FHLAFSRTLQLRDLSDQDESKAATEFQASVHELWISTQIMKFMMASLKGNMAGMDFSKTALIHPELKSLDLRGITAHAAAWMAPILSNANLSYADLSDSEMRYAKLLGADLTGANLCNATFGRQNENKGLEDRTLT